MSKSEDRKDAHRGTQRSRTFTEIARRKQIVEAAIATIAEDGYQHASYTQIAKRAGLSSTGLISYHFASKAELIGEVVAEVVAAGQGFMLPRIKAAAPGSDRLRAYITSNLEFMAAHPAHMQAVAGILSALRREAGGQPAPYAPLHAQGVAQLEEFLREGQRNGQFRRFAPAVMALAIRAAIDEVAYRMAVERDLDLAAYGRELAALFDHAAAAGPPRRAGRPKAGET
ncbi:MAG TPA: TetR/AcrR family transcriptional regulator [Streptosporangiaceae bacterium]|nr:TetR/AcrR family transcriptional regulator [Streptosporangiaceae bacterium]